MGSGKTSAPIPAARSRAANENATAGFVPGKFATRTGAIVTPDFSLPASSRSASSRSRPIEAPTPGSLRGVKRLARLSYRPPEATLPNFSQPLIVVSKTMPV